jgi:hypothetical protein
VGPLGLKEEYNIRQDPFGYFWENFIQVDYECAIKRADLQGVLDAFCKGHQLAQMSVRDITTAMSEHTEVKLKRAVIGVTQEYV